MDYSKVRVLWKGITRAWHHCDFSVEEKFGYAIICINGEHFEVHELLEIYYDNRLVYSSSDVWYAGMLRSY